MVKRVEGLLCLCVMLLLAGCGGRDADKPSQTLKEALRECAGLTPADFINQYRIRYAARLLTTTDDPVGLIIEQCGQSVTENEATLPWTKSIEVTLPFHAKVEGDFTFNEADLPDQVLYGKCIGIGLDGPMVDAGNIAGLSKQKFLDYVADHPEHLHFAKERDF